MANFVIVNTVNVFDYKTMSLLHSLKWEMDLQPVFRNHLIGKKQSPSSPVGPGGGSAGKPPVKQQVKPFTRESLERLENKTVQLVRDYGFQPRRKLSVEDGSVLPPKFEPFPSKLYGRPLEEIDNFIYDETFCVVSKRFRKNYIHRFTATRSFFFFSPWNTVRQTCIFLSTNQYFDYVVMATILLNCVFLAMTEPIEEAEFVFLAIYTAEMIIKSIAKGFILNKYTYLRNPWNWLDFVVITSGYATIGMEVGNLAGLRTFRVLRALKTVSIMPGLKTIINALLHSFKQLAEVMTLTIFCLMVFALFALQVYMGELRNKCVLIPDNSNISHTEWIKFVWGEENWLMSDDGNPVMCGNTTGSRHCPENYVCLRVGGNPNHGFTNFDNFLWSMLTTFQLITLDYWENVYNMVLASCGPVSVVFFTVVVFFGSFYLINLMLAVVALSYEEEAEITQEERKKDLVDHRDDSTFSFDPSNLDVKQLDKNKKKKIDSRKGVLLSSYTRKKTRRRKTKGKDSKSSGGGGNNGDGKTTPSPNPSPRHSSTPAPPARPRVLTIAAPASPLSPLPVRSGETLYPGNALGPPNRGQLHSRQASSNSGEGNYRESSLDDSGVVDDHEEGDAEDHTQTIQTQKIESVTIAVKTKEKEIRVLKCNGVSPGQDPKKLLKEHLYTLPPDYLSHIVVLDDLVDRNCENCTTCCVDYDGWLRFQNCLYKFVRDPLFELLITVCIVLNTIFLAIEHHGMSESVRQALDIGNKVFTSIFTFECFLKLLALSKEFFDCGWNIFDLIIVSASLLDLSIEIMDGLTVLRGLRLLRVLKLAQSWTTMKVLLSIIISTIGALGNLTFVLVIVIYIFAVIGMQLFSKDYTIDKFAPDPVPRWNFNDFFHSFMMIFRILCGEWIEPLWDCMRAEEVHGAETCFFIFLPALVMGNFMVLNLFLALLLNSFNSEELKNKKEEVGEESKLARSFERIRSIVKKKKYKQEHTENEKNMKLEEMVRQVMSKKASGKLQALIKRDDTMKETVMDGEQTTVTTTAQPQEEKAPSPDNIFSPDHDLYSPEHRLSATSQDLSQQLQKVLNEKMKSLQSSRNQLFDYGEINIGDNLDVSPLTDRKNSASDKLFSPPIDETRYSALSTECQSPYFLRKDGQQTNPADVFSPGCETCFHFSPEFASSPGQRSHSGYTPRPSDNQLTFLSPPDSNSCSSAHDPVVQRRSSNSEVSNKDQSLPRKDSKNIFSPVNVSRYSSDNQTPSPISDKRSFSIGYSEKRPSISTSERRVSNLSQLSASETKSDKKSNCGERRSSDVSQASDRKSNQKVNSERRSSQLSSKSSAVSGRKGSGVSETKEGISALLSDRTSPKYSPNLETSRSSPNQTESQCRDSSTSESEPVYSPPSHSSLSPLDRRYSVVFSPPSDTNFSFSLPVDKIYGTIFSPPTITDSSTSPQALEVNKSQASPNDTIISTPTDKKMSPELEERPQITEQSPQNEGDVLSPPPTRDKHHITPLRSAPKPATPVGDTKDAADVLISARDKRLSYFLAIEQGESKDSATESIGLDPIEGNEEKPVELVKEAVPHPPEKGKKPWHALVSYVDELTVGGRRDSKGKYIDGMGSFPGFGRNKKNKTPQDCFPQHCYQRSVCCNHCMKTDFGQKWTSCRTSVLSIVDTPMFEWVILVLIFSSSITLCFEDIYLDQNKMLKNILYWTNFVFCALFSIEMLLKWVALGFWRYFTSFWTILDFIIVFVSIFSLLIEENENLKVLRSLRTLRALRPLRAISRWQGMRIVVNALMYAIPSIFNVLLVCLVFWLIFSIMGVQFFGGKFFKCLDEQGELLPVSIVNDRFECLYKNYTWVNSKITFDHVGQAYLALFQVATFEGWMEVMADAVDARGEDLQPQREANLYGYIYFVIFIVCGSFFTLNLFIGVIIDNFNMLKKKYEGGVLEMFLTESQKHYYTAMKKLGRKKPQKVIHRPLNQFLAMFYDLSNSRRFEIAIFILIFLNMVSMAIEHYDQPHAVFFVLEVSNAFFTTVFGLEAIVKIIGLRHHYFTVPWNVFDFLLVIASILGILMEDIMIDFPVSPTLLRVVRVFRIGRILRLIKAAKGIRKLLFALVVSLPALFNIGALLSLITFIYAIIGMSVFGHVKQQGALDDMVNFETFGRSMQLLFRLMTSAGWNDVLESLMIQPPDCDPHLHQNPNGDCGYPLLAITYFVSFIIINYMIVINMYIAIILENFNQAHQEEEIGIVEDDLEMFYIRWSKYDPHATQFIRFNQLSDFIASLDPPLGIPKPNIVALVSFNLPIARGNKIHCLDILHSLVKHVLGHVEETDDFKKLQDQMDIKFKKQFPTRKELEIVSSTRIWKRQDKAARLIQKTFKEYLKRKQEQRDPMDLEDEMTQTSSPGGWQGKLSAFLHVHRGSRASSRKSSRASDASDLSELGGPWLNLPLLLLGGTQMPQQEDGEVKGDVCITVSEASPDNVEDGNKLTALSPPQLLTPKPPSRRGSFNFLQRRGSAKEKGTTAFTSPKLLRRCSAKEPSTRRKEIPLSPRRQSAKEKSGKREAPGIATRLGPNGVVPVLSESIIPPEVNITVTEPSPQSPSPRRSPPPPPPLPAERRRAQFRQTTDSTVVHVLVHRESEEYNSEEQGS